MIVVLKVILGILSLRLELKCNVLVFKNAAFHKTANVMRFRKP